MILFYIEMQCLNIISSQPDIFHFKASNCNVCGYNIKPVKVNRVASKMATKLLLLLIPMIIWLILDANFN